MPVTGHFIQTSFNGGEWSELLEGRIDIAKYKNAVYKGENFLLYPHGPATLRPGTRFIHSTKDSSKASRAVPFEFNAEQAYVLEFGDQYIRFYRNQAIITQTAQNITGATKANPCVITYSGSDTYANGENVIIAGVVGMVELNNREFTVANVNAGANTFELSGINSTSYTTYASGGTVAEIYEITSPFLEANLFDLQFCQSADTLYIFHSSYAPRKLTRTGHTSWTLTTAIFNPPATKELGIKPATTLTPGATTGAGVTFTAGGSVFQNGDVDRLITSGTGKASITAYVSATQVTCDIIDDFASTSAIASQSWTLNGSPSGNLTPTVTGPAGAIATFTSTLSSFRSTDVGSYIRVYGGFAKITTYTSATEVKGQIIKELSSTTATANWTIEAAAWSATNGYPSMGVFFEERLCVSGVTAYPETIWGSVVGDYQNFTPGTDDADAFEFTLSGRQVNVIRWIEAREYLLVGTIGSEWRLGPEDTGSPLTPLNVVAKLQKTYGSDSVSPVTIGDSTMFVQRSGRKIRELTYSWESEGYKAPDMTILAEHVTISGIKQMAYQQEPLSILWAITNDGVLLSLAYLRDEEVTGWMRHPMPTDAIVESITTIPGDGYDELWAVVRRTVNSGTVRYMEMLEAVFDESAATHTANLGLNAFFVDSGLTYNGTATTSINGLWHLRGKTVAITANGGYHAQKTVSATGVVTLDASSTVVHIGLPFTGKLETMRLETGLPDGTAQDRIRRTAEVMVRVYRSKEFKVGRDADNTDSVLFRTSDDITGATVPLYTGDKTVIFEDAFDGDNRIVILQDKPLPLTVLAIVQKTQISR